MAAEHGWRQAQLALAGALVWLGMTNTIMSAGARWNVWQTTHVDLPIAPGRAIHIHVGDPYGGASARLYPSFSSRPLPFAPLRVALRYRGGAGWRGREIFVARVPTWPLAAVMPGLGLALLLTLVAPRRLGIGSSPPHATGTH